MTLGFTNVTTTNGDYTTTPVVVTFLAGATTATATVQTTEDTIAEPTETLTVSITTSTGPVGLSQPPLPEPLQATMVRQQ